MYLTALFNIFIILVSILAVLFLVVFFRAYNWKTLKDQWLAAVKIGTHDYTFRQRVRDLLKKGNKEFKFDNGAVSIYARSQEHANYEYRVAMVKLASNRRIEAANRRKNRPAYLKSSRRKLNQAKKK